MDNTENELLPLDEHLCFMLYATSRAIQRLYHSNLTQKGLTYPQYLVLVILYEHDNLTVKRLGEYLKLDSGTITPLLKRMEKAGLLKRHRDSNDERIVYASMTSKGRQKREAAQDLPDVLRSHSQLSQDEWQTLMQLVNKLLKGVD
ncbi:MarR family transcriptional regulator [Oenococcus sp. UCMA 16435]|nr:MarR family transcriptional regulator [Oenococcus sp. UCMA 16435]MDI4583853.1 MarR family transcriptional regulator [Oenococcus sp. UCMA 14587]MDN6968081.1 MarR family transcriptional regulator [Oenococcus sp. UCMA 17063]